MKNEEYMKNIKSCLKEAGYDLLDEEYYQYIYQWLEWYKGKVKDFHSYNHYNGYKIIQKKRSSLGMPKAASEDWATLLYNDKTCISVDETHQDLLLKVFEDIHFNSRFSDLVEKYFALGTGATVVYNDPKGKKTHARVNFIPAPMIFPIRCDQDEIIDCAFGSIVDDQYYLNIHIKNPDGSYTIKNRFYNMNSRKPQPLENDHVQADLISPVKMFQIYKPCIVNNLDLLTPFGISVYANAIDENKTVDLAYDGFNTEISLGRKRLFLKNDLLLYRTVVDTEGTSHIVPVFDENQEEFFMLPGGEEKGSDAIQESVTTLRVQEYTDAIQVALNLFSDAVGLGPDRFSFKDGSIYTNTSQVISTQSKLYKNLKKHEKVLQDSMIDLIRAVLYAETGNEYTGDVTIDFDDSIIEDTEALKRQALLELNAGLIDPIEYYVQIYKMTEEQATEFYEKIQSRKPQEETEEVEGA